MRTGWSDGPEFVTQCPIRPGQSYTYRFTVAAQEGTLWWHAHSSWLRATVYGALVIRPRDAVPYPFDFHGEVAPIMFGTHYTTLQTTVVDTIIQVLNIMNMNTPRLLITLHSQCLVQSNTV
jgi:FtsP/CotA-like multicopper oxidase with cupredoxin domain